MNRKSFIVTLLSSILLLPLKLFGKKSDIPTVEPGHAYHLLQWSNGEGLHKVYVPGEYIEQLNRLTVTQGVFAPKAKFSSLPRHCEDPFPLLKRVNAGERFDKKFFLRPADKSL